VTHREITDDAPFETTLLESGQRLHHHRASECRGECCLHGTATAAVCRLGRAWRSDRRMLEHVCSHGIGHPCPSTAGDTIHGCDGCCGEYGDPAAPSLDEEVGAHAVAIMDLHTELDELREDVRAHRRDGFIGAAALFTAVVGAAVVVAIIVS
jgi:hypothetical protein